MCAALASFISPLPIPTTARRQHFRIIKHSDIDDDFRHGNGHWLSRKTDLLFCFSFALFLDTTVKTKDNFLGSANAKEGN